MTERTYSFANLKQSDWIFSKKHNFAFQKRFNTLSTDHNLYSFNCFYNDELYVHIVNLKPPGKRGFACDAMIQTVLRRDIAHLNVTKVNPCKRSVTYGIIAWHALVTLSQAECPHTAMIGYPCSPTWCKNVYYLVCIVYINWNFRLLPFVTTWPYNAPYQCFFKAAKTLCKQVNVQPSCGISVHEVPERKTVSDRNCNTAY